MNCQNPIPVHLFCILVCRLVLPPAFRDQAVYGSNLITTEAN